MEAAHAALEAANTEQRQLLALTDTALSNLALEELMRELLSRVQEVTGADNVAILLLDESGQELQLRAAHGLEEEAVARRGFRWPGVRRPHYRHAGAAHCG